jgi:hypothetical protein
MMTNEELDQIVVTYNSYLERMNNSINHFCEDIADNDYREISMVLPAIAEGLTWINEILDQFVKLGKIPEQKKVEYQSLLKNMTDALENKDNILLGDLCRYELIPLLAGLKIGDIFSASN